MTHLSPCHTNTNEVTHIFIAFLPYLRAIISIGCLLTNEVQGG